MYWGGLSHIKNYNAQSEWYTNTFCVDCLFTFLPFVLILLLSLILVLFWSFLSIHLCVLSLCTQVSRAQWPCSLFSCWTITWRPGSLGSGMVLSPWASPSVGLLWEACYSLSSGNLHHLPSLKMYEMLLEVKKVLLNVKGHVLHVTTSSVHFSTVLPTIQ